MQPKDFKNKGMLRLIMWLHLPALILFFPIFVLNLLFSLIDLSEC